MPRERQYARRTAVNLPIGDGNLAVGTDKAIWPVRFPCRLLECSLALRTTGATSGNTDVDVNKNGVSVLTAPGLRIAQGAATKHVSVKPGVGVAGHPAGVPLKVGDVVSVDIDAIPGTASTGGLVTLTVAPTDV